MLGLLACCVGCGAAVEAEAADESQDDTQDLTPVVDSLDSLDTSTSPDTADATIDVPETPSPDSDIPLEEIDTPIPDGKEIPIPDTEDADSETPVDAGDEEIDSADDGPETFLDTLEDVEDGIADTEEATDATTDAAIEDAWTWEDIVDAAEDITENIDAVDVMIADSPDPEDVPSDIPSPSDDGMTALPDAVPMDTAAEVIEPPPDVPVPAEDVTVDTNLPPPPVPYFDDFFCRTLVAYAFDAATGTPWSQTTFLTALTNATPTTLSLHFDVIDAASEALPEEVSLCYQSQAIANKTYVPEFAEMVPHCDAVEWAAPFGLPLRPDNVDTISVSFAGPDFIDWALAPKLETNLYSGIFFVKQKVDPLALGVEVILEPESGMYCFLAFSTFACTYPPPDCP